MRKDVVYTSLLPINAWLQKLKFCPTTVEGSPKEKSTLQPQTLSVCRLFTVSGLIQSTDHL